MAESYRSWNFCNFLRYYLRYPRTPAIIGGSMTTHISLRQMALSAGVEEELDTTDIEVYLHGTIASFGLQIIKTTGGC
jgi:hypothetical protein